MQNHYWISGVRAAALGLGLAVLANGCRCFDGETADGRDPSGWEDVFSADLSNAEMKPGSWAWDRDGFLTPLGGEEIFSKKDYSNFVLDVAYVMDPTANSGLFLYDTKHPSHKYEVQILDDRHPMYATEKPYQLSGAIYGRLPPSKVVSKPAGELNRMMVFCRGKDVKVFLNGIKVVDADLSRWTDPDVNPDGTSVPKWHKGFPPLGAIPMHGRIALQGMHGGKAVHFKHLKVKQL